MATQAGERSVEPSEQNIQTFTVMFKGLAGAIQRFDVAVKGRDPTNTFIPLFELLNWAVALDDRAGKHWTSEGKPLKREWRKKSEERRS